MNTAAAVKEGAVNKGDADAAGDEEDRNSQTPEQHQPTNSPRKPPVVNQKQQTGRKNSPPAFANW